MSGNDSNSGSGKKNPEFIKVKRLADELSDEDKMKLLEHLVVDGGLSRVGTKVGNILVGNLARFFVKNLSNSQMDLFAKGLSTSRKLVGLINVYYDSSENSAKMNAAESLAKRSDRSLKRYFTDIDRNGLITGKEYATYIVQQTDLIYSIMLAYVCNNEDMLPECANWDPEVKPIMIRSGLAKLIEESSRSDSGVKAGIMIVMEALTDAVSSGSMDPASILERVGNAVRQDMLQAEASRIRKLGR